MSHSTAYCIVLTLIIISMAMLSIEKSHGKKNVQESNVHQSSQRVYKMEKNSRGNDHK